MSTALDAFPGLDLEAAIARRARASGVTLAREACARLAVHARAVLAANERLHLTSITEPHEFLERHLGEAFEGAALLPEAVEGILLEVGSGNGYPALPIAAARAGLHPLLVEASEKKSTFLSHGIETWAPGGEVLFRQVQRASDLPDIGPVRVLTIRAVGGWTRLLPKLVPLLANEGVVLLWASDEVEAIRRRVAWRRLRLETSHPLPGRERSAVWLFRPALTSNHG